MRCVFTFFGRELSHPVINPSRNDPSRLMAISVISDESSIVSLKRSTARSSEPSAPPRKTHATANGPCVFDSRGAEVEDMLTTIPRRRAHCWHSGRETPGEIPEKVRMRV